MTAHSRFQRLLSGAREQRVGIGAFNVVLLEHAEAIVAAAESAERPVMLQISENCVRYHGALAPIALACLSIARSAEVEVLLHLDHIETDTLIREGIDLGVHSVMFDGSRLPYAENVAKTRSIAQLCHPASIAVEAELGEIGGKDGVHAPGARTDPGDARRFVEATGIDALAVAVGTSHAMQTRNAEIDHDLVQRLRDSSPVPLVLHGSSGVSDDDLRAAVANGLTKINISTHLNGLFTKAVRDTLAKRTTLVDPREYVGPGRAAITDETARLLSLLALGDVPV